MDMPATDDKEWTVEMLETLPDDGQRYEIIDGELFVSPGPVWRHQHVLTELMLLFGIYLRQTRCGVVLTGPADVVFDRRNVVEPDLFITPFVNGQRPESYEEAGSLLLAVEVLSPSTSRLDRTRKRNLYRRFNVAEYWIVDTDARVIERWRPDEARPEILDGVIEWKPSTEHAPLQIDLPKLFAGIHGEVTPD